MPWAAAEAAYLLFAATRSCPRACEMSRSRMASSSGPAARRPLAVAELLGGDCRVERFGRDGAIGEHRDDVVVHLHEAAVGISIA